MSGISSSENNTMREVLPPHFNLKPIKSNLLTRNYQFCYLLPVVYLINIFYAEIVIREKLLWSNDRIFSTVTSSFAYDDYCRWVWLCLSSVTTVMMILISCWIFIFFFLVLVQVLNHFR